MTKKIEAAPNNINDNGEAGGEVAVVEKLKAENASLKKQIEQINQEWMKERNALSLAIVKQAMKM